MICWNYIETQDRERVIERENGDNNEKNNVKIIKIRERERGEWKDNNNNNDDKCDDTIQ